MKKILRFKVIDLAHPEFQNEENQVTKFMNSDEVGDVLQLSVAPAPWKGAYSLAIALVYEHREKKPTKSSIANSDERAEPEAKRSKPQPLR